MAGYTLRRHIAKALQVRSKALRAALARYNSAAAALQPPQISMSWADVIDYAFLAHFDILRDPEGSAALRAWSDPLARALIDGHFKIQRAKEEIKRLNIEIRRFVTYMRDEKVFLLKKEAELTVEDPDFVLCAEVQKPARSIRRDPHESVACDEDEAGHQLHRNT